MSDPAIAIVILVIAYFIGAIPFGVIIGRVFRGVDIRSYGSGGSGATNVTRTLGPVAGGAVLLADVVIFSWLEACQVHLDWESHVTNHGRCRHGMIFVGFEDDVPTARQVETHRLALEQIFIESHRIAAVRLVDLG